MAIIAINHLDTERKDMYILIVAKISLKVVNSEIWLELTVVGSVETQE